jgi:hypothetical protein
MKIKCISPDVVPVIKTTWPVIGAAREVNGGEGGNKADRVEGCLGMFCMMIESNWSSTNTEGVNKKSQMVVKRI